MKLFGFTFKQWALILGQLKKEPKTLREALNIRWEYIFKFGMEGPPENPTIILDGPDPRDCNYEAATSLFMLAP